METKPISISQSFMKMYKKYIKGEACGLLMEALYVTKTTSIISTHPMELGQFFEYISVGTKPRDNKVPSPVKASKSKNAQTWVEKLAKIASSMDEIPEETLREAEDDMYADYLNLMYQANHLKRAFKYYEIEILELQKPIVIPIEGTLYVRKGVIDIYAMIHKPSEGEPHECFIDIKATGDLGSENKKSFSGWDRAYLHQNEDLIIQPIDYKNLAMLSDMSADMPFYFFVHSSSNALDRKIYGMTIGNTIREQHEEFVKKMVEDLQAYSFLGYTPYPTITRCAECPLKDTCKHARTIQKFEFIDVY